MKRDFHLAPPGSIRAEVFDRSRDVNGNPTAHYLLTWDNGLTGEHYAGGHHRTRRRVQVGYRDKASGGALGLARDLFPGTAWDLMPGSLKEDRRGDTRLTLTRAHERESVPVLFRAEKSGDFRGQITAVFPTLAGTGPDDVTVYARIGQHSTGTRGWYNLTRAALPGEFKALARELESLGYVLDVRKRWAPEFDEIRRARLDVSRAWYRALQADLEAVKGGAA